MTMCNIPHIKEACDIDGNIIGETSNTIYAIYMPKDNYCAAYTVIIRVQDGLIISDDPYFDSDLYNFAWGREITHMTTQPRAGLYINLLGLNRKINPGEFLGYVKVPSGMRIILIFMP